MDIFLMVGISSSPENNGHILSVGISSSPENNEHTFDCWHFE
jgi:hypothetical protein